MLLEGSTTQDLAICRLLFRHFRELGTFDKMMRELSMLYLARIYKNTMSPDTPLAGNHPYSPLQLVIPNCATWPTQCLQNSTTPIPRLGFSSNLNKWRRKHLDSIGIQDHENHLATEIVGEPNFLQRRSRQVVILAKSVHMGR